MTDVQDVVTGAFGYIGRYIAAQLLEASRGVRTITTHVDKPNPFGLRVKAYPYNFDHPGRLTESLRDVDTLYNTYWIRFEYGGLTFDTAVENTKTLFTCAAEAGVRRIVHISVTHASTDSALPYYAGKGQQEQVLKESGVPYSIVRPTLVFGREDILVNNIARLIRKFPVFPIMGDGQYKLQPVYVGDLAAIAINCAAGIGGETIDAIGSENMTFLELVESISAAVGKETRFLHVPPGIGIFLGNLIGIMVGDVILTRNELKALMNNYLISRQNPNGSTRFSEWLELNGQTIGSTYSSELNRHFRWTAGR